MHWQELSWVIAAHDQPLLEEHLEAMGAAAISASGADAAPSFEVWPGEAPTWEYVRVVALFDAATELDAVQTAIQHELGHCVTDPQQRRFVDRDWVQDWSDNLQAQQFGGRLWVVPTAHPAPVDASTVIHMDPGVAFGSGTHETTAMCLEWLVGRDLAGLVLVDYGCGSGILSIAALALGAKRVIACDIDPQALEVTRVNAERNGVAARLEVFAADAMPVVSCDLLLANILLGALEELAPNFAAHLRPGGLLLLSGILAEQLDQLRKAYQSDFDEQTVATTNGWARVVARRKPIDVPGS